MPAHRTPALALSLLLATLVVPAPAAADACSATGGTSVQCSLACNAGYGVGVTARSPNGGQVTGEARCPTLTASCHGTGSCQGGARLETQDGEGTCTGWAERGGASVTCLTGATGSASAGAAYGLALGRCDADLYAALDLRGVVRMALEVPTGTGGGDSFIWSPVGGCVQVVPDCYDLGYQGGRKGLFCGVGPNFNWNASHG